jgi:hypothetical protein
VVLFAKEVGMEGFEEAMADAYQMRRLWDRALEAGLVAWEGDVQVVTEKGARSLTPEGAGEDDSLRRLVEAGLGAVKDGRLVHTDKSSRALDACYWKQGQRLGDAVDQAVREGLLREDDPTVLTSKGRRLWREGRAEALRRVEASGLVRVYHGYLVQTEPGRRAKEFFDDLTRRQCEAN